MCARYGLNFALLLSVWFLVASFQPLAAEAGIYKWTDERGQVIYSDRPPPGQAVQGIVVNPGPSPEEAEAARQRLESIREAADQRAQERAQREETRRMEEAASPPAEREATVAPPADNDVRYGDYPVIDRQPTRPAQPAQLPAERPRPAPPTRPAGPPGR
jgi:hypothetical protein